jgi:alpha/beta superfamily hydrolase
VPAAALRAWLARLPAPPELAMIDAAGHFFHGELKSLREGVGAFLRDRLAELDSLTGDAAQAR